MNISFFNRLPLRKVVIGVNDEAGQRAQQLINNLLQDLPEALLICVVDVHSGRLFAWYSASAAYNPNRISLRNGKLLRLITDTQATHAWLGGPLVDITVLLEDQFHCIRPLPQSTAYCFLAARTDDVNLGIAKEIMRRHLE
ncbi:hypothetical protein [Hymenobacter metallilatus]|uniref:Uncharacterized protein n=1 Tax=Hymenobacter metallilatus TaxID=2493666 RepID=A0A3R9UMH0_9BACT|nr:hypothetical protein [Hymenobacter metallilatus]RSK35278.1 hypothetical protein EI290_06150 [Hymenobacter metallilatus]